MYILIGILIGLTAALGIGMVLSFMAFRKEQRRSKEGLLREDALERQLATVKGKQDEYRALTEQVAELIQLRDNLEVQTSSMSKYLNEAATTKAVAEVQIKSANTQFKEIQEKVQELERLLQERKAGVDTTVKEYEIERRNRMEAELAAEAESKRRAATEALVKELEELRQQVEAAQVDKVAVEATQAQLNELVGKLRDEADQMAKSHAEALRRLTLESGAGGTIRLEQTDREDAALIRKIARGMKCENAVLKATYDVYIKPEIERVVRDQGVAGVSGIYRIWKKDGERELSYIGQAVDVGERWKTHAKRAWGVDNTGRIKLYQAMMESGIEQWNWELVEAVPVTVSGSGAVGTFLSEREKYWGGYYAVKEVGLNSKLG